MVVMVVGQSCDGCAMKNREYRVQLFRLCGCDGGSIWYDRVVECRYRCGDGIQNGCVVTKVVGYGSDNWNAWLAVRGDR